MTSSLVQGNALWLPLRAGSVQMCVTSPPYFSLRDYGVGAQIGLEGEIDEYVEKLVQVFREVRRVLRDDGVVWLNLGDSYNGSGGAGGDYNVGGLRAGQRRYPGHRVGELKPKDMIGVPWRVAFALQADGWWLRSDVVWSKPNPMPESATDRPTKAHEYLFLLAKSQQYFYDGDAIREGYSAASMGRYAYEFGGDGYSSPTKNPAVRPEGLLTMNPDGRNKRTVWTIPTQPTPFAHFATFPEKLVEPCIKAGSSEYGACSACNAPYRRVVERTPESYNPDEARSRIAATGGVIQGGTERCTLGREVVRETKGWLPTCQCAAAVKRSVVLDPFSGSGTVGLVCQKLGRDYIGVDLSMEYHQIARQRLGLNAWQEWQIGRRVEAAVDLGPLFEVVLQELSEIENEGE